MQKKRRRLSVRDSALSGVRIFAGRKDINPHPAPASVPALEPWKAINLPSSLHDGIRRPVSPCFTEPGQPFIVITGAVEAEFIYIDIGRTFWVMMITFNEG